MNGAHASASLQPCDGIMRWLLQENVWIPRYANNLTQSVSFQFLDGFLELIPVDVADEFGGDVSEAGSSDDGSWHSDDGQEQDFLVNEHILGMRQSKEYKDDCWLLFSLFSLKLSGYLAKSVNNLPNFHDMDPDIGYLLVYLPWNCQDYLAKSVLTNGSIT